MSPLAEKAMEALFADGRELVSVDSGAGRGRS